MKTMFCIVTALLAVSCATITLEVPEQFARFDKERKHFRMASADGILITAKQVSGRQDMAENKDLSVWRKEMELFLASRGYIPVSAQEVKSKSGIPGILLEHTTLFNGEQYHYIAVLYHFEKDFYLVEVSGPEKPFGEQRKRIDQALNSVRVE